MRTIAIVRDPKNHMNRNYCAAVEAAGANAVMLEWDSAPQMIQTVDGIIIPGGADINPAVYGEENTDSIDIDDRLDRFEMFVIGTAIRNRKPILGICRGHQLMYEIYGQDDLLINSAHHQAIQVLADDLRAVQYSTDGEIEAIEHRLLPIYGVQWHPERTCLSYARPDIVNGLKLFDYFLETCSR